MFAAQDAQARRVRVTFLFVDDQGVRQQETFPDARYAYFERKLLNVRSRPSDSSSLPHRDRTIRRRALLLQEGRISFQAIRSIEFSYRGTDTEGTEELVLRLTLTNGKSLDVRGRELKGFASFRPPCLEGVIDKKSSVRFSLPAFRRVGEAPLRIQKAFFHSGTR